MRKLITILLLSLCFVNGRFSNTDYYYGDSIMFGNELAGEQYTKRWPTQYAALNGRTEDNQSHSGWTLVNDYGGNGAFEDITPLPAPASGDRFFLGYHINDIIRAKGAGATISQLCNIWRVKMPTQIERVKAAGFTASQIVWVWNYFVDNAPYNYSRAEFLQLKALGDSVITAEGIRKIDYEAYWSVRGGYTTVDGDLIHPDAAANTIEAQVADSLLNASAPIPPSTSIIKRGRRAIIQ